LVDFESCAKKLRIKVLSGSFAAEYADLKDFCEESKLAKESFLSFQ
jgi:hypothetical protein